MRISTLPLFIALLVASPLAAAQRPVAHDAKLEAAVDAYLRPLIDLHLFQGAVLIARGDQVVFEKAYGFANLELKVRNTPAQVFRIASLSKPFTEVALGHLSEERKLSLGDPLSRYLPNFPRGQSITLDMLRTHRAGIPSLNSIPFDEEATQPNSLDSLVRRIAREPLAFEPGSARRYSNGGYALLAAVIEKASGKSYADYMERAVFEPLGLRDTRHETDQMVVMRRAYGYTASPEARHALVLAPYQQMMTKTGGGSLVSTVRDLHRFLLAMNRDNAIQASTWRTLFPPDSVFSYQGRCPGFNVWMGRDFVRDVDAVVLCNNYAAGMVGNVGDDLLLMARGGHAETPRWRADVAADSAASARFLGTYAPPRGALPFGDDPVQIRWRRGDLVLFRGEAPLDVLVPQGGDAYLLRNLWSEMRLTAEAGKVKATMRPLWFKTDPVPLEPIVSPSTPR